MQRGRDHGLPDYNRLRVAYGLPAVSSFASISSNPVVQVCGVVGWVGGWGRVVERANCMIGIDDWLSSSVCMATAGTDAVAELVSNQEYDLHVWWVFVSRAGCRRHTAA